ncbi:MAG: alpha/beta hydrolase [Bacteriovorax sp.]|nr:alpha/beta hydrolase [Bacteriovorax sp.]
MKVTKLFLNYQSQKTNALVFLPEVGGEIEGDVKATFAILTHGYTADKSSIINWPIRLAEAGVSCILFDLPGHYLGNFSEVEDFEHFKNHGHELFYEAFLSLKKSFIEEFPLHENLLENDQLKLVLGGHSLGAMLSLKALMLPEFKDFQKLSIAVGLGMAPKDVVHIFDTPFYKSTLKVREQLVSPALKPDNVFPWIKEEKQTIDVHDLTIHLITGADDLVVGNDGMERFAEVLKAQNNSVTTEKPAKLPHHEPQLAASYLKKYLKKINWL